MDVATTSGLVYDLGIIMILVTILGIVAYLLRQPIIPVYILAGLILNLISENMFIIDASHITALSELGIAFLLFLIGMELDIDKLKSIGKITVIGTSLQVLATAVLGILTSLLLDLALKESILLGLVVAFSSTALVIKYLSDNDKIDSLEGRIAIGMLIMQDILVVMLLPFITPTSFSLQLILIIGIKALGFLTLTLLLNRFLIKQIMKHLYKNPEIAFIFSLSVLFVFSILSTMLGFSVAIGGFLAGLSMAVYPYSSVIVSRITHLRDFFLILFFVSLGLNIHLSANILNYIPLLVVLALITIFIKPIIITFLLYFFGIDLRTSIATGLSLNQISEFSLILSILAFNAGNINKEIMSLVALLLFITAVSSSYFLKWNDKLAKKISKKFSHLDHATSLNENVKKKIVRDHILLFGANTCSRLLIEEMYKKYPVILVDYDPLKVQLLKRMGYDAYYGDVLDESTLKELGIGKAKMIVCCIADFETTHHVVGMTKGLNKFVKIIVKARNFDEALKLYEEGADYVIIEGIDGIDKISTIVKKIYDNEIDLDALKKKELTFITKEKEKEILAMHLPKDLIDLKNKIEKNL